MLTFLLLFIEDVILFSIVDIVHSIRLLSLLLGDDAV